MKLEIHSQIDGNILTIEDDGSLTEEYCAGGARYNNPQPVDWDNLSPSKYEYYERVHKMLLTQEQPHLLNDYYPQ